MNRNKLIELFISNLSNAVVHKILEKAINIEEIAKRYNKEIITSWEIAKKYREKINPLDRPLPFHDIEDVKSKIINKVNAELLSRIENNYKNIDLSLVKTIVEESLKEMNII